MTMPASSVNSNARINLTDTNDQSPDNDNEKITQQTAGQPSKAPTTSLPSRAIKCAGKILLGVFTIPTMVVLTTLTKIFSGLVSGYLVVVMPAYKRNKLCALILAVTLAPVSSLLLGASGAISGPFVGIKLGIEIANEFTLTPLKNLATSLKNTLSGKEAKIAGVGLTTLLNAATAKRK